MVAKPVADEKTIHPHVYYEIDGQLDEIKRQLRQRTGYPFNVADLRRALHHIIIGEFRPMPVSPPKPSYGYVEKVRYVITDDPMAIVRRARREAPRSQEYTHFLMMRSYMREDSR